jgi:hypothetical protein
VEKRSGTGREEANFVSLMVYGMESIGGLFFPPYLAKLSDGLEGECFFPRAELRMLSTFGRCPG